MKPKSSRHATNLGRRALLYGAGAAAVAGFAAWQWWPAPTRGSGAVLSDALGDQVQTLARGQYPVFAGSGEIALYRYAVDHGDELQYIPCFCGCVRFGHKSNRDCYIKAVKTDGTLTFTSHAVT
jgi:hypothetical protein